MDNLNSVSVMITEEEINRRVCELASEIERDYRGCRIHMVCALKGAVIFLSDLSRKINLDVSYDFVVVSSYGDESVSGGAVCLKSDLTACVEGRHVLLVEDIIDTGHTIVFLREYILSKNPASFKVCSLLDKPDRRVAKGVKIDYLGFSIPDRFAVGYGLDYAQRYRNLPYIGALKI
ncbi:MAG: hypoxanthine phosphoribosyltransferase [Defluviitaleaceae bacterium]|nr:hypoxanthine phosphoribosyltransferase [Defluviitaleaceae bacterium]